MKTECLWALSPYTKKVIFMTIKVKAGTPTGVHSAIPNITSKEDVTEFDESIPRSRPADVTIEVGSTEFFKDRPTTRKPGHAAERVYVDDRVYTDKRAGTFLKRMEEGFSAEETNQGNPFGPPAAGSTKPRTLSEAMTELVFRFRLLMVEVFLPEDYEVVQVAPQRFLRDFLMEARELWQSYEPLLGKRVKSDSILQVEAPPEEDE